MTDNVKRSASARRAPDEPHAARSAARLASVQALFEMEFTGRGADIVIEEFSESRFADRAAADADENREGDDVERFVFETVDADHFAAVVRGVAQRQDEIDPLIDARLAKGWRMSRIDPTARAILRAGVFELLAHPDIPYKVVIDEYVEVANAFFDGDEPSFVNAALDAVAKARRDGEIAPG